MYLYDNKDPVGNFNKNYPNNPKKQQACEILDLGTYCKMNKIDKHMLSKLDGKDFKILIDLYSHMQDKLCSRNGMSPDLLEDFEKFLEFKKIQEQMSKG